MKNQTPAKIEYVIIRIKEAVEAFNRDKDVLDALSAIDAADEASASAAGELFGNRQSYLRSIDEMIADSHLLFTCNQYGESIENIAGEIVEFVDRAQQFFEDHNPFNRERATLIRYKYYTDEEFSHHWAVLDRALVSTYSSCQVDVDFFKSELLKHRVSSHAYSLARQELTTDWERQLTLKEIDFELKMLSDIRRKFDGVFREKLADFRSVASNPLFDAAQLGLFWSLGRGEWIAHAFDIFAKYALLIEKNSSIQVLLADLGRDGLIKGKELVNAKKEIRDQRFAHASKSDIVGITESDDLSSLLPAEVAMLGEAKLEDNFYRRFAQKQLQTFCHESQIARYVDSLEKQLRLEEAKSGPFIVCIDTSGSMCGTPEELAKTICYGLIIKSQQQKRNCFVIIFSTTVEVLDISDLRGNPREIVNFLTHSFHGGTDLAPAIKRALQMLTDELYVKADVLFISDFIADDFDAATIAAIDAAKRRKTRFHALQIGSYCEESLLCRFNVVWNYLASQGEITLRSDSTKN